MSALSAALALVLRLRLAAAGLARTAGGSLDGGRCELREFRPSFSVNSATSRVSAATWAISVTTSGSASRIRASLAAIATSLAASAASSSAIRCCSALNSNG